jgi:ATP-dependent helicase/nuclease subunit B
VQVRLLLGPAGSGKTFRCLTELREALSASPDGPSLLLIAPRQTTYQLERQLLAVDSSISGYTRLHILSFERLAHFIFERLGKAEPRMLDEEGRVMVLRGILAEKRDELKLFRASARLTGFAQQLSTVLRELQRNQLAPETLRQLAVQASDAQGFGYKLHDLAILLESYLKWLWTHNLQDADSLLEAAAQALRSESRPETRQEPVVERALANRKPANKARKAENKRQLEFALTLDAPSPAGSAGPSVAIADDEASITFKPIPNVSVSQSPGIGGVWVDGFSEWTAQELDLLAALIPHCDHATLTFCLDAIPSRKFSWLSNWSVPQQSFEHCKKRLEELPGIDVAVELLNRDPSQTRFVNNPILQQLEVEWPKSEKLTTTKAARPDPTLLNRTLRVATCINPEAEATVAAREIRRHVRSGGRFRDVTVLVRKLESYHQVLQRIFSRYEIPCFLDRRELVTHHPLAELTRNALRTVAFHWQRDDWFAALKTGLLGAEDKEIDELENEALARGWKGAAWHEPIRLKDVPKNDEERQRLAQLENRLEQLRKQITPAFQRLALLLGAEQNKPSGPKLAAALRAFWQISHVEQSLERWASGALLSSDFRIPNSVHATVWSQMNRWLDNIEMAFPHERLALREWLPILDAGLANLTVGVIPPALDQVLIGAIDRSRNPEVKLAIVLGMNESVFPARPDPPALLTETDCAALQKRNVHLSISTRRQLARERHYAYVACTRARERLVLTYAFHDDDGTPLNPSPFISDLRQIFPSLEIENVSAESDWRESEHASELVVPVLTRSSRRKEAPYSCAGMEPPHVGCYDGDSDWDHLAQSPALAPVIKRLRQFDSCQTQESVAPDLAAHLYGPALRSSVSRMEQFAACPFKFFVHSGLRAEERKLFELDVKEKGTFQHDILAEFHNQLRREKLRWRDISPEEARARVGRIAQAFIASYRNGLLQATEASRFSGKLLTRSLQDFIETLVSWMREQYKFDPVAVELPFGEEGNPPWKIPLDHGHTLELHGRIDRVDLFRNTASGTALCVVVDYKSSRKQLDRVFLAHGLQLQLLAYLNVIRQWPNVREPFGANRLVPAGVFYVNLRGRYERGNSRLDALADPDQIRKRAYRHAGRFDAAALPYLDGRSDARNGDQFNYRVTREGDLYRNSRECLSTNEFIELLDTVEGNLKKMGAEIFSGRAAISPYRKGAATACDQCEYRPICRIDPWTHQYRLLKKIDNDND